MPWKRVNIEPNGDMNICSDYADIIAGNLLQNTFQNIWNNDMYKKFRKNIAENNFMPMCKHCTYAHINWKKR